LTTGNKEIKMAEKGEEFSRAKEKVVEMECPSESGSDNTASEKPTVVIVLGMAGSGKTTFVQVRNRFVYTSLLQCNDSG